MQGLTSAASAAVVGSFWAVVHSLRRPRVTSAKPRDPLPSPSHISNSWCSRWSARMEAACRMANSSISEVSGSREVSLQAAAMQMAEQQPCS